MHIWTERRLKSELNHELLWGSLATLLLLASLLLPLLPDLNYPCPFLHLTGRPCLSCGTTRAFESAIRGRFLEAFRWNPLGLAFFLGLLLYVPYAWAVVLFRLPPLRVRLTRRWEGIALLVLLLALLLTGWIYLWTNDMPY